MKQNSQSKREYKTPLKKRAYSSLYYYKKALEKRYEQLFISSESSKREKDEIAKTLIETLAIVEKAYKQNLNEDTYAQGKAALRDAQLFFRRMNDPDVNWSVGRYINKYGFHDRFLPYQEFIDGSVKLSDAIQKIHANLVDDYRSLKDKVDK